MYRLVFMTWVLLFSQFSTAQSCQQQHIRLQVLGSGGPELTDGRVSSSHLLWKGDQAVVVVDAGSGSAHQFELSQARLTDVKVILLTHLHVDHAVDLPTYIKASYFTNRDEDLWIMGPAGNDLMPDTTEFLQGLFGPQGTYAYLSEYWSVESSSPWNIKALNAPLNNDRIESHQLAEGITISSIAVHHGPISAVAWRVDMGDCSVTFSGDMSNNHRSLQKLAKGTDLLVANNAIEEGGTGVARKLHMPPSEIGSIASEANVKRLLLAHFMNRSLPHRQNAVELIGQQFKGPVLLAEDGLIIDL